MDDMMRLTMANAPVTEIEYEYVVGKGDTCKQFVARGRLCSTLGAVKMAALVVSLDFSWSSCINRGCFDLFTARELRRMAACTYNGTSACTYEHHLRTHTCKTVDTRDSPVTVHPRLRLYSMTIVPIEEPPPRTGLSSRHIVPPPGYE